MEARRPTVGSDLGLADQSPTGGAATTIALDERLPAARVAAEDSLTSPTLSAQRDPRTANGASMDLPSSPELGLEGPLLPLKFGSRPPRQPHARRRLGTLPAALGALICHLKRESRPLGQRPHDRASTSGSGRTLHRKRSGRRAGVLSRSVVSKTHRTAAPPPAGRARRRHDVRRFDPDEPAAELVDTPAQSPTSREQLQHDFIGGHSLGAPRAQPAVLLPSAHAPAHPSRLAGWLCPPHRGRARGEACGRGEPRRRTSMSRALHLPGRTLGRGPRGGGQRPVRSPARRQWRPRPPRVASAMGECRDNRDDCLAVCPKAP